MLCPVLKRYSNWDQNIKYSDIYGTLEDQVKVTNVLSSLLEIRELLLEEVDWSQHPDGQGLVLYYSQLPTGATIPDSKD